AAGEYSIADMACYPWIVLHERQGQNLNDFPNLQRWFETIQRREPVQRAYALAKTINPAPPRMTQEAKAILFGQGRRAKGENGRKRKTVASFLVAHDRRHKDECGGPFKRLLFVRRRHEHELQTRLTKSSLSPARSFKNVGMVKLFGANLLAAENTVEARRVNVLVLQDSTLRLILPPLSESVSRRFFVYV